MNTKTQKLVTLGMLSAIAYVIMVFFRVPVVLFLSYDPKDIIIALGGFIFGPLSALSMSVVVSVVEMITVSNTGPIGLVMNILSTCAFACTASAIYKARRSISGAIIGLLVGSLTMTGIMILWNYLITPLYLGVSREEVAALLVPAFLPFNLLKAGLNAGFTYILYKPVIKLLRKINLVPTQEKVTSKSYTWPIILFSLLIITCILIILVWKDII